MALSNPFNPPPNTQLIKQDAVSDSIWRRWFEQLWKRVQSGATGGDVVGPASSTDNAAARWDGTTGKLLQNSGVIIDDSNNVSGIVNLTTTGNTILGDAGADTITFNAAAWTLANNVTATRTAGTVTAGIVNLINYVSTYTADAGGTSDTRALRINTELQGANNAATNVGLVTLVDHGGSGTVASQIGIQLQNRLISSGNITLAEAIRADNRVSGSGTITTSYAFSAEAPVITGGGAIGTHIGLNVANPGSASITTFYGVRVVNINNSTTMSAVKLEMATGTGKKNLDITGTADNSLAGPLYLAQDDKTQQTASAMYAGTGAPNNANGSDGDFYFRGDGGVLTTIYQRRAGAWVGVV